MEDHPSEEVEETKKVESIDEEKEVVESDREISIDGNSVSVNGRHEAEYIEKSPPILDPEFIGSVVDSVQPAVSFTEDLSHGVEALVEKWEDPSVTEVESKDFEDKITPPLDVTDGVPPVIEDVTLNGNEETQSPSSYETNGLLAAVTDVESSGTEESIPPSLDKKTGITPVAIDVVSNGIEETTLPSYENVEIPHVVMDVSSKETDETKLPTLDENTEGSSGIMDLASSKETFDHSLLGSADSPAANISDAMEQANKREIPEGTGNSAVISVSQRTLHPTSWRNCCGLFEFLLWRSDR